MVAKIENTVMRCRERVAKMKNFATIFATLVATHTVVPGEHTVPYVLLRGHYDQSMTSTYGKLRMD